MAAGVVRAADKLNIDIPGQLSVAGFDNISLAQQIYPSLTTIHQRNGRARLDGIDQQSRERRDIAG
jgi:DNA-binding LacI/PurR family transcriptional regulator